ncbi:MAG: flippase-like domain-containing protein [Verrucomicrobia bacterium]|nr:flippase-like domain-containing protein [Verrucomicrobiota bacterium]
MSARRKAWQIGWRLAVCGLLLFWIFHAIFTNEGKLAWQNQGGNSAWDQLPRSEQWQRAWTSGPRELWRTVRTVKPAALVVSVAWVGVTLGLGILRWRMALRVQGLDLPLSRAAEISFVAHFFNSFLLGSTGGDLMKAYYAARETHHKKAEAVTTVFVDRLIGLFTMLLFAGLMMLPNLGLLGAHRPLAAVSGFTLAMLAGCGAVVWLAFRGGVSRGLPQAREWLRRLPKGELLERSLDSCRVFGRNPAFLLKSLALSTLLNACCVLQVATLAWGLDLKISFSALLLIVPVVVCISALPITPSGLGVRENLFVLMLAVPEINIPQTSALTVSLLAFAGSLFWSLIGGAVYVGLRERHHLREIQAEE